MLLAHSKVINYVHEFVSNVIMACIRYILVNQYRSKSKDINTTCKHYLAKQESSIDLNK